MYAVSLLLQVVLGISHNMLLLLGDQPQSTSSWILLMHQRLHQYWDCCVFYLLVSDSGVSHMCQHISVLKLRLGR